MRRQRGAGAGPLLVLLLALAGGGIVRSPAAGQPATPGAASPIAASDVYLALGDSIAVGIGAGRPAEGGYVALVRDLLERHVDRPVELVNLAVPGATTGDVLAAGQIAQALDFVDAAARTGRRVNPITLTAGANDLIRAGADDVEREDALRSVGANLRQILGELGTATDRVGGTPPDLVVTTYYDPAGTDPTLAGTDGWWIARLNEVIVRETVGAGGRIADVARRFGAGEPDLTRYPSDVHPTDAGHRLIADEVWRTLGYDTTPPAVRLDRPAAGPLERPVPTVLAVATDDVGVVAVDLLVDGAPAGPLPYLPEANAYADLWDARAVSPGPHTLAVRATDAAGNTATAEVDVTVGGRDGL